MAEIKKPLCPNTENYLIKNEFTKYLINSNNVTIECFYVMNHNKGIKFYKLITRKRDRTKSITCEVVQFDEKKKASTFFISVLEARIIIHDFKCDDIYRFI